MATTILRSLICTREGSRFIKPNSMGEHLDSWILALVIIGCTELGADMVSLFDGCITKKGLFCEIASDACKILDELSRLEIRFNLRDIENSISRINIHWNREIHTFLRQRGAGKTRGQEQ